ncbi:hypothetical protein [Methylopila sp. Yamaguchi]|uniref:hypothetical protein n=1 Tax=Methylopila sp. Yamaguchi TaxID=1437817 RepID=UPI000CB24D81|nr:hypothetical protein [Methylopila sp. Yamaguchi]GBD48652.1 hypothetical protein METY_1865 [Methylopila sp. Yamaguchi]
MTKALRLALPFGLAVLATALVASVVQTQVNLAALALLGAPLTLGLNAATTAEDLVRFGPVMAAIAGAALLPALLVGLLATRFAPRWRTAILGLAGVAGLWTAFAVMGFFTPMPTLVAAVRGAVGLALMCTTGLVGGLVFARLTDTDRRVRR